MEQEVPFGGTKRTQFLGRRGGLDPSPEERFDRITRLVSRLLGAPISLVCLVDPHRHVLKSAAGLSEPWASQRALPLSHSFCKHVVAGQRTLAIADAREHPLVRESPALRDLGVISYVGVPLRIATGEVVGTLCAYDRHPRSWTEDERTTMEDLAAIVVGAIDETLRIQRAEAELERRRDVEMRFGSLLRNGAEAISIVDAGGRRLYSSPAVERLFGYDPAVLEGNKGFELIHPEDRLALDAAFRRHVAEGGSAVVTFRVKVADGTWRWLESTMTNLLDEPSIQGIVVNTRDVTERKETEAALLRSERRFRSFVSKTAHVIWTADETGAVTDEGGAWSTFTGQSMTELRGWGWADALHVDERDRIVALWRRHVATHDPFSCEYRVRRHDGAYHWFAVRAVAVFDEDGVFVEWLGTSTDIEEHKRAEEALHRSEERYRRMVEVSPAGILLHDDVHIRFANQAAAEILGAAGPEDLVDYPLLAILPANTTGASTTIDTTGAEERERTSSLFGGAVVMPERQQFVGLDGRLRVCNVAGIRTDYEGQPATQVLLHDETERLQAEMERLQAAQAVRESEERLRLALEAGRMGTWDMDLKTETVIWSSQTYTLFGESEQTFSGHKTDFFRLVHPGDRKRLMAATRQVASGGGDLNVAYRIIRSDGEVRWMHARGRLYYDEAGQPEHVAGTVADVTSRKQAQEALRESEAKYHQLFDNTLDGVLLTDPSGAILEANSAMCQMVGYSEQEICALGQSGIIDTVDARFGRAVAEKERVGQFRGELTFVRRDGSTFPAEVSTVTYLDAAGASRTSIFVRDVTDLKRYMTELIKAKEKAEEMSRLKDAFLANMSHEIRTPLTSIIGFSEILGESMPADRNEFVKAIEANGQRLLETLNSVLDLAQIESGTLHLQQSRFDLVREVRGVSELLHRHAREKGLNLILSTPHRELPVLLDRMAFSRIVTNLLSNAIKFTPAGEVVVAVQEDDGEVIIEVVDTGIGIGADFLPHVFGEFTQESTGLARSHEGNGLGLTITKRLVDLMGGRIKVESEPGRGSTFTVHLPAASVGARTFSK